MQKAEHNIMKRGLTMQEKYAVVEHYPDGNSSIIMLCPTEQKAQDYATQHNRYLFDGELPLTVKRVQTMAVPYGQTITF